jgi:hypothetical protein
MNKEPLLYFGEHAVFTTMPPGNIYYKGRLEASSVNLPNWN